MFAATAAFFTVTKVLFLNSIYVALAVAGILFCLIVCGFEKIIKEKLKFSSRLYVSSAVVIPAIFAVTSHIVVRCLIDCGFRFSGGLMPGLGESILTLSVFFVFCIALVGRGLIALLKRGTERQGKIKTGDGLDSIMLQRDRGDFVPTGAEMFAKLANQKLSQEETIVADVIKTFVKNKYGADVYTCRFFMMKVANLSGLLLI